MGSLTDPDKEFMPRFSFHKERRTCPHCRCNLGELTDLEARKAFTKHEQECQVRLDRDELKRLREMVDREVAGNPAYKIRRKTDGQFSKGGSPPSFSKKGKLWASESALKLHLNTLRQHRSPVTSSVYEDCEVIQIMPVITERTDAREFFQAYVEEKNAREAAQLERQLRQRETEQERKERAEYERLREKFGT
jgi:hypothetical protein